MSLAAILAPAAIAAAVFVTHRYIRRRKRQDAANASQDRPAPPQRTSRSSSRLSEPLDGPDAHLDRRRDPTTDDTAYSAAASSFTFDSGGSSDGGSCSSDSGGCDGGGGGGD